MKKVWFKAKRYGYGWYPATWQGWLVVLIFLALIAVLAYIFEKNPEQFLWQYLTLVFLLSSILVGICYKTGEKAKWRWGNKD